MFNSSLEYNVLYGNPNVSLSAEAALSDGVDESSAGSGAASSTEVSADVVAAVEVRVRV